MNRKFKSILLVAMVIVLTIMIIVPSQTQAGIVEIPGIKGAGEYGDTCFCPWFDYNCGCGLIDPKPF